MTTRLSYLALVMLLLSGLAGTILAQTTGPATTSSLNPEIPLKPETESQPHKAVVVQLEGEINDYTRDDLMRRFRDAKDMGATAIIIEVDSPGGLVSSALDISQFIKRQQMPVIAYVKGRALSAAALISLACDALYMSPHSLIGDAAPIMMVPGGGVSEMDPVLRAKAESPVVEDFRDSAQRNGHNQLLVEAMVIMGREVYYVQNEQGEKRFVNGEGWKDLKDQGTWKPVVPERHPVDSATELLTLNARLAQEMGLAKGITATAEEATSVMGWTVIGRLDRTAGDRMIALLSSMAVRGLLIIALIIAIYLAIQTPGMGFPEAGIAIILGVVLGVPMMTGYAQWWEIALVVFGVALLAVEIFLIPGFGFTGITGLAMIFTGLLMTFVPREPDLPGILPAFQVTRDAFGQGFAMLLGSTVVSLIAVYFLAKILPHTPYFGRLVLTTTVGGGVATSDMAAENPDAVSAKAWVPLGAEGVALTDLYPGGTARFDDPKLGAPRNVDVICDSGFIAAGSRLKVHELQGSTVVVRKA